MAHIIVWETKYHKDCSSFINSLSFLIIEGSRIVYIATSINSGIWLADYFGTKFKTVKTSNYFLFLWPLGLLSMIIWWNMWFAGSPGRVPNKSRVDFDKSKFGAKLTVNPSNNKSPDYKITKEWHFNNATSFCDK